MPFSHPSTKQRQPTALQRPGRLNGLIIVTAFGLIGYFGFQATRAATYSATSEAESGVISGAATTVQDPTASAGSAVKFAAPGTGGDTGSCQPQPKTGGGSWQCSFDDEFDGTTLSNAWSPYPYGSLGQACLTMDTNHVTVSGGALQLIATKTNTNCAWTGGALVSQGKFSQKFGRFEMRAKLPAGDSSWPAFWLLPEDKANDGEIDILEALGGDNEVVNGVLLPGNQHQSFSLHTPTGGPGPTTRCAIKPDSTSGYHTYTLEWTANSMKLLVDGVQCLNFTGYSDTGTSPPAFPTAFNKPYYILFNLAVAPSGWGLPAPASTPMTMSVDYVRVWQ